MEVKERTNPAWAGAIAQPGREFAPAPLAVLEGSLPVGLRGSLYRNGPGRLERGGVRVGHWFDGDGAILAVHFGGGEAQGVYRYVQTAGLQAEERAGRYLYPNYGMSAPGAIWERWGKPVKNAANTSVLALPDRLLALWEGGLPHALDLHTLQTRGLDALGGLGPSGSYSAHPKRDPRTGEIYNFGVGIGPAAVLHLYRSDATGRVIQKGKIALEGIPLVHDFVLAGRYLVFCVPPVRINPLPVLLGLASFSEAMAWQPDKGTAIYIVDRETLQLVGRAEAPAWFQWHFANGHEAGGELVIALCRYADFATNRYLQEFAGGRTQTASPSQLWQLRLDAATGRVRGFEPLLERPCEFPTVDPRSVGLQSRHIYLGLHRVGSQVGSDFFQVLARFDCDSGQAVETQLGDGRYPSEPLFVADADEPERGWVLSVIYDAGLHRSELWIFDADALDAPPVCRLALPEVIPHSFHGTWRPVP
ncbi:carotenoid oxygenase family protein [Gloeobacter violaceus]|uniref:Gll2774 protein n=1 Tax=Gloeobacter violaceus (strain ATCC 29082 / PCC 7421) TaxID=251221 RepID=Q7NGW3_GLOVI|nr:carotenoid oxygenase family protein [Gloeobacter violaceus]BAC90715.1 gll2774 [Gloeobacter violaceus PCC 7421]